MTSGAPWSVKGIDPKAREVAKDLARRSGMTLGEWLNQVILQDDAPEEVTSESYFSDRPQRLQPQAAPEKPAPERPPVAERLAVERLSAERQSAERKAADRYEAPEHPADYVERMAGLLERLSARIETAETRTGQAVSGVEASVRSALARIEAAEKMQVAVSGQVEGAMETAVAAQTSLAERLRKMEEQVSEGPKPSDALRALEGAISKIAGQVYDGEVHTKELLAEVEARIAKIESEDNDAHLIETVVSQIAERLAEAEGRTAEALEGLRVSLAALDGRLQSVEEGGQPALERKLESLAEQLTGSLEQARGEIAEKLQAGADARFDRFEKTFEEMSEHVRSAEQRSASAIAQMGREVLNVAEVLNKRVQTAEANHAQAIDKIGGEMARIGQTVDARLGRSDQVHAEALEKLGAEISRITEKLGERMANAERRSAQAIDDIGEQVARVTERINERAEQTSEGLAERIRQSEERTARLLEEARERIDQRLAETQTSAPAAPAVEPPPAAEYEASTFPAREEPAAFVDDPFAGFPSVEDEAPPTTAGFLQRAFPETITPQAAEPEAVEPEVVEPEIVEVAQTETLQVDVFDARASVRAEAFPAETLRSEEPQAEVLEPEGFSAEEEIELAAPAEDSFADDAFAAAPSEADPFAAPEAESELFGTAAEASGDDLFDDAAPEPGLAEEALARPLTTREVVEQARAAARAAAQNGDLKGKKGKAAKPAGKPSPLFSGFGLSRPKRRAGGTLQTFLLVSGGAAFLGLAAGGIALMNGKPSGETPARVADAAGASADGLAATPRASVALAPQSTASLSAAQDARMLEPSASGPDLEALYAEAVRGLEAGEPGAMDELKKAANLGHAPAQLYLGKVYESGRFGVKADMAEARRWTERAAEGGDRRAMHNVALYYFNGEGGPKNSATAAQWFRRAADLGLVDSQYNLARLYEEGLGVSQNAAEAYKWFLIASRAGDAESRLGAERVKTQLSTEARSVAERAAVGFRAASPETKALAAASGPVSTAQHALTKLGYYQGPTNGEASPALRLAVAAYQRDQGLAATGNLDDTTVSRLTVFTR